jgi:hypothetical protein
VYVHGHERERESVCNECKYNNNNINNINTKHITYYHTFKYEYQKLPRKLVVNPIANKCVYSTSWKSTNPSPVVMITLIWPAGGAEKQTE